MVENGVGYNENMTKVEPIYFRREDLERCGRFGFAPYYTRSELEAMGYGL